MYIHSLECWDGAKNEIKVVSSIGKSRKSTKIEKIGYTRPLFRHSLGKLAEKWIQFRPTYSIDEFEDMKQIDEIDDTDELNEVDEIDEVNKIDKMTKRDWMNE